MASFIYETALQYGSSDQLLMDIQETVRELRQCHPELEYCSLADLSMHKSQKAVNVTLYFQKLP